MNDCPVQSFETVVAHQDSDKPLFTVSDAECDEVCFRINRLHEQSGKVNKPGMTKAPDMHHVRHKARPSFTF